MIICVSRTQSPYAANHSFPELYFFETSKTEVSLTEVHSWLNPELRIAKEVKSIAKGIASINLLSQEHPVITVDWATAYIQFVIIEPKKV